MKLKRFSLSSVADFLLNTFKITGLKTTAKTVSGAINENQAGVAANSAAISTNTADIETNKTNISTNSDSISSLNQNLANRGTLNFYSKEINDSSKTSNDAIKEYFSTIPNLSLSLVSTYTSDRNAIWIVVKYSRNNGSGFAIKMFYDSKGGIQFYAYNNSTLTQTHEM